MDQLSGLASLLTGKTTVVKDQADGPQDGTILSVDTETYTAYVTMSESSFGTATRFGPLPYGRCDDVYAPQVGDNCLVLFVGGGIDRGRIVIWWPAT